MTRCKGCGEETAMPRYCLECTTTPVHAGLNRATLHYWFEQVQDGKNWKNPIDAVLPMVLADGEPVDVEAIKAAVVFYAGCTATVENQPSADVQSRIRVTAVGYYAAVGA